MARKRKVLLNCSDQLASLLYKKLTLKEYDVVIKALNDHNILYHYCVYKPDVLLIEMFDPNDLQAVSSLSQASVIVINVSSLSTEEILDVGAQAVLTRPVSATYLANLIEDLT